MEWLVKLRGREDNIRELSDFLNTPEACVVQDGQEFVLKSTDFKLLEDAGSVLERANEVVSRINGAASIATGMRRPIATEHIIRINDDGTRQIFAKFKDSIQVRGWLSITIKREDGTIHEQHFVEPIAEWLDIANHDEKVAKVLRLFGTGVLNWVNLYRIYEVMESDVNGIQNIAKKKWATLNGIKRFKHTANNPGATGDDARHGKQTTQPPPKPMILSEARSLIESIFHNWIRTKT